MRLFTLNKLCGICLLTVCTKFTMQTANATTDNTLQLEDAVAQTLAHNPRLHQFMLVGNSLKAKRSFGKLAPAIALELEIENFAGSGANQGFDNSETTLALSSVIEIGGTQRARVSVLDAKLNRSEIEKQVTTLDVLGKLTTIYVAGLATQEHILLAKEGLNLSRSLLFTVQKRADRGAAPEAEVMRAKATVIRAEIRVNALLKQFERQKVLLARFWGSTRPVFNTLDGNLFAFEESKDFATLYARVKTSPAIQFFASEARLKEADVKLAKANSRSDLAWRAGVKRFEVTGDSAFTAGISLPLFSKKRHSGNVKSALAERNAVEYAKRDALLMLHSRLYEAYSLREQNLAAVKQIHSEAIPALEKALALTQKAYEDGRYRYQDWIAAQEELLAMKQQKIDAAKNVLLNQSLIEQLTGEALTL